MTALPSTQRRLTTITGAVTLAWGTEGAAMVGLVELVFVIAWVVGSFRIGRQGDETLLPKAGGADEHTHGHGHDAHAAAQDRKSTRLNSSHMSESRMPSSA
mgnify:CR=1 FL=1